MTFGLTGTITLILVHTTTGIHIDLEPGDGIAGTHIIVTTTYGIDLLWLI
jgi:hypothetical protein|tara:strand:- start:5320 stop:5469 length:150 start_codon:yes stop_codon:yes gene_type:complete